MYYFLLAALEALHSNGELTILVLITAPPQYFKNAEYLVNSYCVLQSRPTALF